ncbi:MAG TPA: hypothetical protein VFS36_01890 [Chitinophagaceae bacterium]|jgi:hypothetical protein|nr:hypothetical protein [Chitinophagaceae bacterium]
MVNVKKWLFKVCEKQWIIGIAQCTMEEVIRNKKIPSSFRWIKPDDSKKSYADPFILNISENKLNLLFEEYTTGRYDGMIKSMTLNSLLEVQAEQTLLKTDTHLSYPFLYFDSGKLYLFPESGRSGALSGYEYNPRNVAITNEFIVLNKPLIDASLLYYQERYWIFATQLGESSQKELHIYHSDKLNGHYRAHKMNPVKSSMNGSRPAGNFITVDGALYRPSQNCSNYYGESITIQKIVTLNEEQYQEEVYCTIPPPRLDRINLGIHTINGSGQWVAIDVLIGRLNPFKKIKKYLQRKWASIQIMQ